MATLHEERASRFDNTYTESDRGYSAGDNRSFPALLRELRDEAFTLVRQEFRLAKSEVADEVEEAKNALIASAVGVGILAVGAIVLGIAASAGVYAALIAGGVSHMIAGWLAPLIVGLVCVMIGLVLMVRGKKVTKAEHWRPNRTERQLQETRDWVERKI